MPYDAKANADDLERFAHQLGQFISQLTVGMRGVRGQFAALGETWGDTSHQKYAQEFEHTMRTLDHFIQASNEHIPFLKRKAEKIRDYANDKM